MCNSLSSTSFTKQGLVCIVLEKQQRPDIIKTQAFISLVTSIKEQAKTSNLLMLKEQELLKLAKQAKGLASWSSFSRYYDI